MRSSKHTFHARSGLSIIELVLVTSVLGILARALVLTSDSLGRITSTGNTKGVLQAEAEKAARHVIEDLRNSGLFRQDPIHGKFYPYFFEDGVPDDPAFDEHAHAPAASEARPGQRDFGPNREIVFILPADLDADERPDIDASLDGVPELDGNGDGEYTDDAADVNGLWDALENEIHTTSRVVWSANEISYVVNTGPDGINHLERRVNGGADGVQRVAKYVERVVFEDQDDTNFDIGPDSVRMTIYLRKRTPDGIVIRHDTEVWVSMRNGESAGGIGGGAD